MANLRGTTLHAARSSKSILAWHITNQLFNTLQVNDPQVCYFRMGRDPQAPGSAGSSCQCLARSISKSRVKVGKISLISDNPEVLQLRRHSIKLKPDPLQHPILVSYRGNTYCHLFFRSVSCVKIWTHCEKAIAILMPLLNVPSALSRNPLSKRLTR